MPEDPGPLVVGRIAKPHGLRGECVVDVSSDAPGRFDVGSRLFAGNPSGNPRPMTITAVRPHQGRLLVTFDAVPDRTAAEALHGALLSIPASEAAPPEEGRFYAFQIEGLAVRDPDGADLGVLDRVLESPAHDIWVVRTSDGNDVLVPAVSEFVRSVDPDAGVVVIAPIHGMFD